MPKQRTAPVGSDVAMLAIPEVAAKLVEAADPTHLARVRADAQEHPSRLFANALVNSAWRNGPVEDVHAGEFRGYPLDQRRMTAAEERTLVGFAADGQWRQLVSEGLLWEYTGFDERTELL